MRRHLLILAAVVLMAGAASRSADGGFTVNAGEFIELNDGPGSPGGIFHAEAFRTATDTNPKGTFDTFCVELTEHITLGTRYLVHGIGLKTVNGDRTLGADSAWLYTQFLDKDSTALTFFNFNNPSREQADALQLGIWQGMLDKDNKRMSDAGISGLAGWTTSIYKGSPDYATYLRSTYLTTWLGAFDADVLSGKWSGTGDIKIMNLRKYNHNTLTATHYAQDQLVRVTPELPSLYSAGAVIGCAALWGLAGVVRKRRWTVAL
jgi:hypothetical protein